MGRYIKYTEDNLNHCQNPITQRSPRSPPAVASQPRFLLPCPSPPSLNLTSLAQPVKCIYSFQLRFLFLKLFYYCKGCMLTGDLESRGKAFSCPFKQSKDSHNPPPRGGPVQNSSLFVLGDIFFKGHVSTIESI